MNDLFDIYKNKNILITGHTGFKGSWLGLWLNFLGANVVGYGLEPLSDEDNFEVTGLKNRIIDIRGDIRDKEKLDFIFNKYKPEIVFHLAAQPLVSLSYEKPYETYEINVLGTLNILECINKFDFTKVGIMITTDKCYENKEQIWGYRENDPLGGYDPYSSSKACAEILISSYTKSFMSLENFYKHGKCISSVRAGNVIGGGDWNQNRLIPDCIKKLVKNEAVELRNPYSVRPWQFVLEPLNGYLILGARMLIDGIKYSGAWNFGPDYNSTVTVKEIVSKVIDIWGSGELNDVSQVNQFHEANILTLDCTKSRFYLKWEPKFSIDEALKLTLDWYKNYKSLDMYEFCLKQIKLF